MTSPLKHPADAAGGAQGRELLFEDNSLALQLFGSHHANVARIEKGMDVAINTRGNTATVTGAADQVALAEAVLEGLYRQLQGGQDIGAEEVDAALRMAAGSRENMADMVDTDLIIHTRKRRISPRSPTQTAYVRAMAESELVFALGPAGTGKTYLAVAKAVEMLLGGQADRIVLSRPAVEAGENLGFLPGDMREKVDPYMRPLYDALFDMLPAQQVAKRIERGEIEIAPLAFMRGRTLSNACVIVDEAQNTTAVQMKMLLTRLGENARMVITGDLSQVDLPRGTRSGLRDALDVLKDVEGLAIVQFTDKDVMRHRLVSEIVRAYDKIETRRKTAARYEAREDAAGGGKD